MSRDRSIDEFLGADADGAADDGEGADTEPSDGGPAVPDDEGPSGDQSSRQEEAAGAGTAAAAEDAPDANGDRAVDPKPATYAWSPSGGECARCGATVDARWRDETGLVCPDCKEW